VSKPVKIVLCGLGNVGKALLELVAERGDEIETRYDLRLIVSAAVDIGGKPCRLGRRRCADRRG